MKPQEKLPREILWQHDGHATEEVLTAIADGQEAIVPEEVFEHVGVCQECSQRLGQAALLSLRVQEHIVAEQQRAREARARFPWPAVLVALVAAGLGTAPALLQAPEALGVLVSGIVQGLPLCMRSIALMLRTVPGALQGTLLVLMLGSALVLGLAGYGIARSRTRAGWSRGGA